MNQKGFVYLVVAFIIVGFVVAGTSFIQNKNRSILHPVLISITITPAPSFLPSQPMNISPTQIYVPSPTASGEIIARKAGEQEGSFLIQKINPDSVEGLWFAAYPIPREKGEVKVLHIGDDIGYACEGVSEKLVRINFTDQKVNFQKIMSEIPLGGCPICLADTTHIDTPSGPVSVKEIHNDMRVWTMDTFGNRTVGVVIKTSQVPVPPSHHMVHLVLSDGRELFVSPGHPIIDGRFVGDLMPGDHYNAALVVSSRRESYRGDATFDLLPSGDTGFYWANGILMGSTLK